MFATNSTTRPLDDDVATMDLRGMTLAEEELPSSASSRLLRTRGIVVRDVQEGSMAWRTGIRAGDVMAEADNLPLATMEELRQVMTGLQPMTPLYTLFMRDGRRKLKILYT
jgi:S1-C subfamily serine protease